MLTLNVIFFQKFSLYTYEEGPQNTEFLHKNCVCILTCLYFSLLQSTLHLMQYTFWGIFSTAQNSFWTHRCWCLLVLLWFFVWPLLHRQNISLRGLFSFGETNRSLSGWDQVNTKEGGQRSGFFAKKLLNTQHGVGRCTPKSPITKFANTLKEPSKKFTEAEHNPSQCRQVHWCKWVPRTLT